MFAGRRKGLEAYLSQLITLVEPERVEGLDDFLEYAEHCEFTRQRSILMEWTRINMVYAT